MKIKSFFSQYLPVIISAVILTVCLAYAWTPPSSSPPSGNVATPINTGDTSQSKEGDLNIGGGLKYWITKLGDSFALKNNLGQIKFIVGQDGNTGIGAMDPKNKLEVAGDIALQNYSTTDGEPRAIYVYGHKGTGAQYGMHLGYANNRWRTRIFAPTGRDITFGFHNSTLTNPTQADWSEKVIIRDNGNVGIGRSDPQAKLHVNGRIKALDPVDNNDVATKGYVDAQVGSYTVCVNHPSSPKTEKDIPGCCEDPEDEYYCPPGWTAVVFSRDGCSNVNWDYCYTACCLTP